MSASSANVKSIDAIRRVRSAVQNYDHQMRDAIAGMLLEVRRAQEWVENDRPAYWSQAARTASDKLVEAKNLYEQCRLAARVEDRRSCIDEQKAVERAKRRLSYCEEKLRAAKTWRAKIRRETDEIQTALARLNSHLESDLPKASALLQRLAETLDKYAAPSGPPAGEQLMQSAREAEDRDKST